MQPFPLRPYLHRYTFVFLDPTQVYVILILLFQLSCSTITNLCFNLLVLLGLYHFSALDLIFVYLPDMGINS